MTLASIFPAAYALARRAGIVDRPLFKRVFVRAYFVYKRYVEDPFHGLVSERPHLFRGGHVLDVGGNLGYNAQLFAGALSPGYKVFSFEPEASNFELLQRMIASNGLADRIVAVAAAVGASEGTIELQFNPEHHGDHRIATETLLANGTKARETRTVALHSVDGFVASMSAPRTVAFIKIDVQGYELAVCEGMKQTLADNPDVVVAFEYTPDSMIELGFDPRR